MKDQLPLKIGHLTCLKSTDGTPLFYRKLSNSKQLPLQIVGTLNNIFTYGENYGFRLYSLDSTEFKIIWRMYHSNITLILVEELEAIDENVYFHKLDLIFDALVFLYGLEDLMNIQNVEKFKREIKVAYPLVDAILETDGSKSILFGGYMTNCTDSLLISNTVIYQNALDLSCQAVSTSYGCLLLNGQIIVASAAWWDLRPTECYLINLLNMLVGDVTCRDTPIYLPNKNPHQPLRLLSYNLISSNVVLCFICSDKPSVDSVEPIVRL